LHACIDAQLCESPTLLLVKRLLSRRSKLRFPEQRNDDALLSFAFRQVPCRLDNFTSRLRRLVASVGHFRSCTNKPFQMCSDFVCIDSLAANRAPFTKMPQS